MARRAKKEKAYSPKRTIGRSFLVQSWRVNYYFRGFGVTYTISRVYQDDPEIRGWTAQIIRPFGKLKKEYGKEEFYICRVYHPKFVGTGLFHSERVIQGKYLKLDKGYAKTPWKPGDKSR